MIKSVCIIDYGVGNVKSVINAFNSFGINTVLSSDVKTILDSDAIVLPGVGSYSHGSKNLKQRNLDTVINEFNQSGRPIMGICLGMQLLMSESYEFEKSEGLNLISGSVEKVELPSSWKIPHIGWETVVFDKHKADMFFCHSFVAKPKNPEDIYAMVQHDNYSFCAAVKKDNIIGFQFHPEKSGTKGLKLIKDFCEGGKI